MYRVGEKAHLHIEINGGIKTLDAIDDEHLKHVDSVMIGREIYDNPMIMSKFGKYYGKENAVTRVDVMRQMLEYAERMEEKGQKVHHFLMHTRAVSRREWEASSGKREITDSKTTARRLEIY